jgi:hypothetical protein
MAKQHDVNEWTVSFGGVPLEGGKADGDWVTIEKPDPSFGVKIGVDGEATYFRNHSKFHRVTIRLMQTSNVNDVLSAVHTGDLKLGNGIGVAPLMVKNGLGTSLVVEPEARIEKFPDEKATTEPDATEWVFLCPSPERFVGGT